VGAKIRQNKERIKTEKINICPTNKSFFLKEQECL
jgi:hypothetical protein